jgi:hypothetical protein
MSTRFPRGFVAQRLSRDELQQVGHVLHQAHIPRCERNAKLLLDSQNEVDMLKRIPALYVMGRHPFTNLQRGLKESASENTCHSLFENFLIHNRPHKTMAAAVVDAGAVSHTAEAGKGASIRFGQI